MAYIMNMIIKIDEYGRIVIPISIRKKLKTNIFILKIVDRKIHLEPIKTLSLISLVDSIEVNVKDFTDTHELRKTTISQPLLKEDSYNLG